MRPTRKGTDDKERPRPGDERRSVKQRAIVGMLLVTSAVPCPECGGPLVLHIWPLIALILVARGVAGRARPDDEREMPNESFDSAAQAQPEQTPQDPGFEARNHHAEKS